MLKRSNKIVAFIILFLVGLHIYCIQLNVIKEILKKFVISNFNKRHYVT